MRGQSFSGECAWRVCVGVCQNPSAACLLRPPAGAVTARSLCGQFLLPRDTAACREGESAARSRLL